MTILDARRYACTVVAETSDRFIDFAPYVASIDDRGTVAFQATLPGGHGGLFTASDGRPVLAVATTDDPACPVAAFTSHPDIDASGALSAYGVLKSGGDALLVCPAYGAVQVVRDDDVFQAIGPLGPTMNARGDVAFRATRAVGRAAVLAWREGRVEVIARSDHLILGFEGLPVVDRAGRIAFRATLVRDRQGIFVARDGRLKEVATTGDEFVEIGRFPVMDDAVRVGFVARQGDRCLGVVHRRRVGAAGVRFRWRRRVREPSRPAPRRPGDRRLLWDADRRTAGPLHGTGSRRAPPAGPGRPTPRRPGVRLRVQPGVRQLPRTDRDPRGPRGRAAIHPASGSGGGDGRAAGRSTRRTRRRMATERINHSFGPVGMLSPRRPREWALLALVLHGAVLWMMCSSRWTTPPGRLAERISWMTLPSMEATPPPTPRATPRRAIGTSPPTARAARAMTSSDAPPEAIDAALSAAPSPALGAAALPSPPSTSLPPLHLDLPPSPRDRAAPLTPAQEALQDPRSNTLVLTREERLLLLSGVVDCIAWRRMPDGSIYRGPGNSRPVPGIPARRDGSHVMECVP